MDTLQHCLTLFTTPWYAGDINQLMSFCLFFAAMWLIGVVAEAAIKKIY